MLTDLVLKTPSAFFPMAASRYLDRIAISLSTICIVHCLAMPFVVAILPVAALTFGNDGHFHALMLWLVVPTSAIGFSLGSRAVSTSMNSIYCGNARCPPGTRRPAAGNWSSQHQSALSKPTIGWHQSATIVPSSNAFAHS